MRKTSAQLSGGSHKTERWEDTETTEEAGRDLKTERNFSDSAVTMAIKTGVE